MFRILLIIDMHVGVYMLYNKLPNAVKLIETVSIMVGSNVLSWHFNTSWSSRGVTQ